MDLWSIYVNSLVYELLNGLVQLSIHVKPWIRTSLFIVNVLNKLAI